MSKEILTYEEFLYIENDDEIEVVGYTGSEDPVEIPEYINDKPVTSLGYCDIPIYSTGVKINSNIRSIAIEAMNFKECSPWSEVIFDKHSWINEIIAEKTQPYFSVSSDVLYSKDKTRLIRCFNWGKKKITIPKKVEIIEKDAFWLCDEIEKVTIPENVKYIGDSAFYSDTEITVTGKDTELGVDVAGKIVLAGNEKYIEKNGLLLSADKKRLLKKVGNSTSFIAPKELEIIDNNATGSGKIKKVQLNSGLRYIGHNAFKNAEVPSIIIPNTVEHMEVDAFQNYDRMVKLELEEGNSRYRSDGKAIYEINEDGTEKVFRVSNRTIKEFELPETVKELGPDVFNRFEKLKKLSLNEGLEIFNEKCLDMRGYNCAEMSRIKIPSTVKKIILSDEYGVLNGQLKYSINEDNPNYFFDDDICYEVNNEGEFTALFCQNNIIRRAVINEGTVKISRHAFSFADNRDKESRCNLLNKLELPDSLRTIEDEAFSYCTELIKINLGASVSKISPTAFKGCTKLEKITVSPENSFYRDIDGVLFDKEGKKLIIYPEGRTAKTYEMPDSVEDIGTAFSNVSCIGSLYLSKNIGKLKNDAFGYECGINALHFKSDIKNIDPCAFGKRAYNPRVRENQIEIFAESDYYFNKYLEEKMQGAKGDIIIAEQNDNPEVRKLKKLFSFKKVEDGWCITKFLEPSHGKKSTPNLVIPVMLGNEPIVELGAEMFGRHSYGIESIVVPEGIKRIGAAVFFGHSNLEKIELPASIEKIDPLVFTDMDREFKDLYISGRVIVVPPDCYACDFITNYKFKKGYEARIVIKGEVDYLEMIENPSGYSAKLQEGLVPTDRMVVPNEYRGKPVTKVILCGEECWDSLPVEISVLSIPDNVKKIVGIDKLRITRKAADGSSCITVSEGNKNYRSDGIALYTKDGKSLLQLIDYTVEEYTVADGTQKICKNAFGHCETLKKVILPESIKTLDPYCFRYCTALEEIIGFEKIKELGSGAIDATPFMMNTECLIVGGVLINYNGNDSRFEIPEGVEVIANNAFLLYTFDGSTDALKEIVLPSTLKRIEEFAFKGRNSLKAIYLPKTLEYIGKKAFEGCIAINRIDVAEENNKFMVKDGVLYNKQMSEIILVSSSQKTETLIIPETVNKLNGIYANTNITKVVFNKEITKWEDNFSGCPNLKSVVFPDSQEEIPANAFYNCEKLNSVVLPANLRRIGNRAFYNTALNNIDFPETLEHIGEEAFAKTKFKSITVPKSVRTLGWGSFSGVAEIEIYDSIDPDAKNASAKIDTDNGYPNSLVGYIGMGEAWAMWECAANHKWVNYTIIVKSAETDEIKYIVWMGSDPSQRKYYCFLSSAWGHNATFAFKELDEFFPKIKGAEHKVKVAQYRLEYPVDLSEEAKKKYESYIKRYAKKGE